MQTNVLEIETVLNQEFNIISDLEKHMRDKKIFLIKNDIEGLRNVDIEIERLSTLITDLETKKSELLNKTDKKQSLSDYLNEINDKNKAKEIFLLKEKIKNKALDVQKQNNINAQLIQHSLKLVEQTVMIITNALMPESSAYNSMGKVKKNKTQAGMSSIIQEA